MLSRSARGNPVHLLVPIHVMLGDSGARQLGMRHCQCDAKPHLVGDTNPTRESRSTSVFCMSGFSPLQAVSLPHENVSRVLYDLPLPFCLRGLAMLRPARSPYRAVADLILVCPAPRKTASPSHHAVSWLDRACDARLRFPCTVGCKSSLLRQGPTLRLSSLEKPCKDDVQA